MKNNICFREIQSSDYQELENLIRETWNYDSFTQPQTAKRIAKIYLASCLACQTYTCVALNDEKPVGIIMANNKKNFHRQLKYLYQQFISMIPLLCTKEGRYCFRLFAGFEKIDQYLLNNSGKTFDGEIVFFALNGNQQGHGIGKQLFDRALSYLKSQNVNDFYLYTDSTCNFGFYEHQGMKRLNQKTVRFDSHYNEEIEFYLYSLDINNHK